jgi:hypothetical protein
MSIIGDMSTCSSSSLPAAALCNFFDAIMYYTIFV